MVLCGYVQVGQDRGNPLCAILSNKRTLDRQVCVIPILSKLYIPPDQPSQQVMLSECPPTITGQTVGQQQLVYQWPWQWQRQQQ